jgi:hypothetical protein
LLVHSFWAGTLGIDGTEQRSRAGTCSTVWKAQEAHQQGSCGSLGPGTGLEGGKGWVVSMLPGKHEFRVRGVAIYLTTARQTVVDFDVGRPYYLVIEGAPPGAVLEWKMLGRDWQPVAKSFLYPPSR